MLLINVDVSRNILKSNLVNKRHLLAYSTSKIMIKVRVFNRIDFAHSYTIKLMFLYLIIGIMITFIFAEHS